MVWFMVSRASRFIRGSDCMNPVSPALNCPMSLSMLLARVTDSFSPASIMGNDRNFPSDLGPCGGSPRAGCHIDIVLVQVGDEVCV